jgi:hypothetical protein
MVLPLTGFTFPTEACTTGSSLPGTRLGPAEVALTFNNLSNGCTASTTIIVAPNPLTNPCLAPPEGRVTDPVPPNCATPAPAAPGAQTTDTITITNRLESQALNITGVAVSGANAANFTVLPTTASNIPAGGFQVFTVTFQPPALPVPAADTPQTATVTFTTNSPSIPTLSVCVTSTIDVP